MPKIIRFVVVATIIILLLPLIIIKSAIVFLMILLSPSNYEQKNLKSNAIYEAVEMPIRFVKEIYRQEVLGVRSSWGQAWKFLGSGLSC